MLEMKISEYLIPGDPASRGADDIRICRASQRDGSEKWAVRQLGSCLNKQGEWEDEPSPSSRDDAFLARCRFDSVEEAAAAVGVQAVPRAPGAQRLEEIQTKLIRIMVAGCTCLTKAPDLKYHEERCHYRLASEVSLMLGSATLIGGIGAAPVFPEVPSKPKLIRALEWSSDYRCPKCGDEFNVSDDSDAALDPQRGHRCERAAGQVRDACCQKTVLVREDGPAYCADCPLRQSDVAPKEAGQ